MLWGQLALKHMQILSLLNLNKNTKLFIDKWQMNSFFTVYWWYLCGADQTWKTVERFYERTESKIFLFKIRPDNWLQTNRILRTDSLYRSTKRNCKLLFSKIQVIVKTLWIYLFPMHPFSTPWKHQKTFQFPDVFGG